ncbi:ABC transporter ATP-binding protein [Anaerorhabdus furcosa]|uniref:Oligopeptide transport system ATP-binding protein n=1 Tax=Anaerorhabdus furcosa TaxID=118967 RepID=A0A1T4PRG9_9FIRM|nr:ATP-binding cassette domain-containing protein [Anaerorhabdus furcosa]SJZ94145.1 oligopeptide transport system ATP-binding protein [Anaerorhabdus furcosa]
MEKNVLLKVDHIKQYFKLDKKNIVKAVDDVSFEIYQGETFGLVGESGSGKTTIGRSIIRLYNITDGDVVFDGKKITGKISKEDRSFVTRNMQMIFQDPMACLNPRMSVKDIIAEGIDIHKIAKTKEERDELVYKILEKVGLSKEHAGRYPHEFSGGQRQRIGIARALITNPKLVICDEPISALDVSIQSQVVNLLKELQAELGLTYLFIAHDLSMVRYISDRIAVMHKGKLVELAPAEELYVNALHPYTKSLLSAIPKPDPRSEKVRVRHDYEPNEHDYENDKPSMREIKPNHFIYCNDQEFEEYKKEVATQHEV